MFLVVLKGIRWVCLYQNTVHLARPACHLLSKSVKKYITVLLQILLPRKSLLVHSFLRYVS